MPPRLSVIDYRAVISLSAHQSLHRKNQGCRCLESILWTAGQLDYSKLGREINGVNCLVLKSLSHKMPVFKLQKSMNDSGDCFEDPAIKPVTISNPNFIWLYKLFLVAVLPIKDYS